MYLTVDKGASPHSALHPLVHYTHHVGMDQENADKRVDSDRAREEYRLGEADASSRRELKNFRYSHDVRRVVRSAERYISLYYHNTIIHILKNQTTSFILTTR